MVCADIVRPTNPLASPDSSESPIGAAEQQQREMDVLGGIFDDSWIVDSIPTDVTLLSLEDSMLVGNFAETVQPLMVPAAPRELDAITTMLAVNASLDVMDVFADDGIDELLEGFSSNELLELTAANTEAPVDIAVASPMIRATLVSWSAKDTKPLESTVASQTETPPARSFTDIMLFVVFCSVATFISCPRARSGRLPDQRHTNDNDVPTRCHEPGPPKFLKLKDLKHSGILEKK